MTLRAYPPGRPMKPPTRLAISIFRSCIESTMIYQPASGVTFFSGDQNARASGRTYRIDLDHTREKSERPTNSSRVPTHLLPPLLIKHNVQSLLLCFHLL